MRFHSLVLLALMILGVSAVILIYISKVEKTVERKLIDQTNSIVDHYLDNVASDLLLKLQRRNLIEAIYEDEELRNWLEGALSYLVTPEIRYVYMVYRDEKGRFRYLVDASPEDKGELGEKLDVLHEDLWVSALETGRNVLIIQENISTVGATFLKPFIQDHKPVALFVVDFSVERLRELKEIVSTARVVSASFLSISLALLIIAIHQYLQRIKVEKSLYVDPLTGLLNRRYMLEKAVNLDTTKLYVALIDVDDFRKVNATYGEKAGDQILRDLAKLLRDSLPDATIIRFAGEEFLILLPRERFSEEEVITLLDWVRRKIKGHNFTVNGVPVRVTVSIGVNVSSYKTRSLEEAIRAADEALLRAKRSGKDRVEIYTEEISRKAKTLDMARIREAIESGRVVCFYQPIVELKTGKISHYEALARLLDKQGNPIPPSAFLDVIKGTFEYVRLLRKVIEINFQIAKEKGITVSINLMPSDLLDEEVFNLLESADPEVRRRIILEITEVEDIPKVERIEKVTKELREKGYSLCIDDFGSGYSNLLNLTRLQIDYLKIDGTIVREIDKNKVSYNLTKMITEFCKDMNIKVIAEFIDREEVLKILQDLGVDYGQGYLLGKPVPIDQISEDAH